MSSLPRTKWIGIGLVLLFIGCCFAALDMFGTMYDLEPNEPGYEQYGAFGAACFLFSFPIMIVRTFLWMGLAPLFSSHPNTAFVHADVYEYILIWVSDIAIVFLLAGIVIGFRHWVAKNF